jgi:lipid-binding SYLF domain-containing protein
MYKHWLSVIYFIVMAVGLVATQNAYGGPFASKEKQRVKIDADSKLTLSTLLEDNEKAKSLYNSAYGYATFNVLKISLAFTGGGGQGVAINKATGERIYMRMGTGGLNLGLGGQVYKLVFLFEDSATFNEFVTTGWEAGASANAVAGPAGLNAGTSFINGVAVYQITEAGLMLQADISGTHYWRSKLNQG